MDSKDSKDGKDAEPTSVDWFYCSRCDKTASLAEESEHRDWHMAQDLQNEENSTRSAALQSQNNNIGTTAFPQVPQWTSPPGLPQQQLKLYKNRVDAAADFRSREEQDMQNAKQSLQLHYRIYNTEVEPEHDFDGYCGCPIHQYQRRKWARVPVQRMWNKAVLYPGQKAYYEVNLLQTSVFAANPYNAFAIPSPYGRYTNSWNFPTRPSPQWHEQWILATLRMNNTLNSRAQHSIDSKEPKVNIWSIDGLEKSMANLSVDTKSGKNSISKSNLASKQSIDGSTKGESSGKKSRFGNWKKSLGIKSTEEKDAEYGWDLKQSILEEETGRWPDAEWREIVTMYQDKTGIREKVALLRDRYPIQYLHLLRAGYFEPIPVEWAKLASNPLKFSIEAASGWPGITPAWRGYEDTAEERLYWVLNHRGGSMGPRLKPDFVSVMNMALARMASAVEPPPQYFSADDTCHLQHTSEGYSKQVMPPPFRPVDRPEVPSDDTMILLDISGSMDFEPLRPIYDRYLIQDYFRTTQPKNKAVAKAIVKRFTDAMINHDHQSGGYDLVTFSSRAQHLGTVNHRNFEQLWSHIQFGGGTRVMAGWQKVKELHFQKHSQSAIHHPVYGWQAGPQTPILRLLLLLDGEATDMDEFELDLLGLSWAHVTIFLIGVDGCPHHHRHANELQRISDVNPHVTFVDAQGNMPERFVTHELLKRHLGYDISMHEFEEMEHPPPYVE